MPIIFEIVYEQNRPVLKRIEEIYGKINIPTACNATCNVTEFDDYDPIQDDPELKELDRLMRQVPRAGGYK